MVRGRRVRTLVASAKNDGCDSPKRKDQKLDFTGRIANTIGPSALVKSQTITDFFQVVEVEVVEVEVDVDVDLIDDHTDIEIIENDVIVEENNFENYNNINVDDMNHSNIAEITILNQEERPPSTTPHRIVLPEQNSPTRGLSLLHIEVPNTNKRGIQSKARRRLNTNPTTNQVLKTTVKDDTSNKNKTNNHTLTEYFPVRRSERKTKKTISEEKRRNLEQCIRNEVEEGLETRVFSDKGRGVVASQQFNKGDFVVEYRGDLIDITEAKRRESKYAQNENTGCYMYYFRHNDIQYCIDATAESGYLGRLVNHSRSGNLSTKTVTVDGIPRLVLIAKDDIMSGDEVTYDYGDRSKESLMYHPWLAL